MKKKTEMTSTCPSRSLKTDLHVLNLLSSIAFWILDGFRQREVQQKIGSQDEREFEVFTLLILPHLITG